MQIHWQFTSHRDQILFPSSDSYQNSLQGELNIRDTQLIVKQKWPDVKEGSTTAVGDVEAVNEDGKRVAKVMATCSIKRVD